MATAKKSSQLQVTRKRLSDTQKKLVEQRKESQQKINALKHEMKIKVAEALASGYNKAIAETVKQEERYISERNRVINSALSQFDRKNKRSSTKKKTTAKKTTAKKSTAKKTTAKKTTAKKTTARKISATRRSTSTARKAR